MDQGKRKLGGEGRRKEMRGKEEGRGGVRKGKEEGWRRTGREYKHIRKAGCWDYREKREGA